jgi:hypothetical protein
MDSPFMRINKNILINQCVCCAIDLIPHKISIGTNERTNVHLIDRYYIFPVIEELIFRIGIPAALTQFTSFSPSTIRLTSNALFGILHIPILIKLYKMKDTSSILFTLYHCYAAYQFGNIFYDLKTEIFSEKFNNGTYTSTLNRFTLSMVGCAALHSYTNMIGDVVNSIFNKFVSPTSIKNLFKKLYIKK